MSDSPGHPIDSMTPPAPATGTPGEYATLGGHRVFVEAWGSGDAVVCAHGLGGGSYFFEPLAQALTPGHRVIAFDAPGCARSATSPAGFSLDQVAIAMVAAAEREGKAVWMLGHSMGVIAALEAVRRRPELIKGLILVCGLPEPLTSARERIAARARRVRDRGLADVSAEVVSSNFSPRTQRERPEVTALFRRVFEAQPADGYAAASDALATWRERPLPPLGTLPCLVMTGDSDRYAPPDIVRTFTRRLPAHTPLHVIHDCGHFPFFEQPDTFATLVSTFLAHPAGIQSEATSGDSQVVPHAR